MQSTNVFAVYKAIEFGSFGFCNTMMINIDYSGCKNV